ncbi:hypothetical protein [Streptomonospora salina]|uniref:Uncharacterized protein n=1 Tax=Streptomonospora salina TaxID=104205 RepID=A0A841E3G4_9ACTN|nr:hypothetical protein [Streptomonospora salina]MBB5997232.1 hypothetical protein [Streptomonospora salina]
MLTSAGAFVALGAGAALIAGTLAAGDTGTETAAPVADTAQAADAPVGWATENGGTTGADDIPGIVTDGAGPGNL